MITKKSITVYWKTVLLHLFCWAVYFFINEFEPIVEGITSLVYYIWLLSYALLAGVFYLIYFYLNPKFIKKGKWFHYLFAIILLFFVYNLGRELQLKILHIEYPRFTEIPSINLVPITFTGIMLRSFTYYIFHVPLFTCFFIWKNGRSLEDQNFQKDKLLLIQSKEMADLKTENLQSELSFLQSQINPHFLFNILNSFYSKSVQLSPELAEGIEILSSIMRYAISPYGSGKEKKELVNLSDEIVHIENVIKIYNIRFQGKICLVFNVEGNVGQVLIIPFVLITLVENVFKHGELHNADCPAELALKVDNGRLNFYTKNKTKIGIKEQGTSIGLKNVQKRLERTYNNNFTFERWEKQGIYETSLTLDFK